eukprot:364858-Chlamydomonas_euryale.AAC.7
MQYHPAHCMQACVQASYSYILAGPVSATSTHHACRFCTLNPDILRNRCDAPEVVRRCVAFPEVAAQKGGLGWVGGMLPEGRFEGRCQSNATGDAEPPRVICLAAAQRFKPPRLFDLAAAQRFKPPCLVGHEELCVRCAAGKCRWFSRGNALGRTERLVSPPPSRLLRNACPEAAGSEQTQNCLVLSACSIPTRTPSVSLPRAYALRVSACPMPVHSECQRACEAWALF